MVSGARVLTRRAARETPQMRGIAAQKADSERHSLSAFFLSSGSAAIDTLTERRCVIEVLLAWDFDKDSAVGLKLRN